MKTKCSKDTDVVCNHPGEQVIAGVAWCEECGAPICPKCGSHRVKQMSRVTGYNADVSSFGAGKKQELKDRRRVDV